MCFSFIIIASLSPTELRCPGPDWYEFEEFCYKPFGDRKTWHDADKVCKSLSAHLVSIRSMTEQSWLESYLYSGTDPETQEVKADFMMNKVERRSN